MRLIEDGDIFNWNVVQLEGPRVVPQLVLLTQPPTRESRARVRVPASSQPVRDQPCDWCKKLYSSGGINKHRFSCPLKPTTVTITPQTQI
jgi:hypothetical protein